MAVENITKRQAFKPVKKDLRYCCWTGMKTRCNVPSDKMYPQYGGRGIKLCDRWLDFNSFCEDMGERPSPKHSIDRIDNDGDYCPENCRWATCKEQNTNRRNTHWVEVDGKRMSISDASTYTGIDRNSIYLRISKGLAVNHQDLKTIYLEYNGKSQSLRAWGRELGISNSVIAKKLRNGMPVEKVLEVPVVNPRHKKT